MLHWPHWGHRARAGEGSTNDRTQNCGSRLVDWGLGRKFAALREPSRKGFLGDVEAIASPDEKRGEGGNARMGHQSRCGNPEVRHDRWLRSTTVGSPVREPAALEIPLSITGSKRPCPWAPFGERTSGGEKSEAS